MKCKERIIHKHPDSSVSTKSSMSKVTNNWRTTRLVVDENMTSQEQKPDDIWVHLWISPWKSLRLISQETCICRLCFEGS